jgi:hypothetical protein
LLSARSLAKSSIDSAWFDRLLNDLLEALFLLGFISKMDNTLWMNDNRCGGTVEG